MTLLGEIIREEIVAHGPMTFARFMELALYHPQHGYYGSGQAQIGRGGDFFTNVSVGAIFGKLLAAYFIEWWQKLGRPDEFTVLEQGAHDGQFAHDVLSALARSQCFESIRYLIVEPFPIWRERQQQKLATFSGKCFWAESIQEVEPFIGIHFSNELFDALPVHLLDGEGGECLVSFDGGRFHLDKYASREESTDAPKLMREIAGKLSRGVILVIDYGYTREQLAARTETSLRVRARHRVLASPFAEIGQADISAHVNWTALIEAAQSAGAQLIGLEDQHHFITGILRELVPAADVQHFSASDKRGLQTLLHPEMLGRSFHALALGKNFSSPLAGFGP
ncbi:MAG: SAM-dependent methyltransferase [Verrucomicrobia bacterium]|nr:SAM-dependent methyltransferase [Verrucomicrobiota bacterium]